MKLHVLTLMTAMSLQDWKFLAARAGGNDEFMDGDLVRAAGNLAGNAVNYVLKGSGRGIESVFKRGSSSIGAGIESAATRVGAGVLGSSVNSVVTGVGEGVGEAVSGVGVGAGHLVKGVGRGVGQVFGGGRFILRRLFVCLVVVGALNENRAILSCCSHRWCRHDGKGNSKRHCVW